MANERLHLLEDDSVTVEFKRPWQDGTRSIGLAPKALLSRMAAIIPPPRRHVTVYSGVLSAHSSLRRWIVPGSKDNPGGPGQVNPGPATPPEVTPPKPRQYIPWHELLRRTFGSEIVCPNCGGALRLIALVKTERTIQAMLMGMGIQQVFHSPGPPKAMASPSTHYEEADLDWNEGAKDRAD